MCSGLSRARTDPPGRLRQVLFRPYCAQPMRAPHRTYTSRETSMMSLRIDVGREDGAAPALVLLLVGVLRHRYSTIADVRLVVANGVLLVVVGLAVAGVSAASRSSVSVEGAVRRYAVAITSSDLDAALAEIAPSQRELWRDWLVSQLGNIYEARGIAVRTPSLVLRGGPYEVTVV